MTDQPDRLQALINQTTHAISILTTVRRELVDLRELDRWQRGVSAPDADYNPNPNLPQENN